MLLLALLLELGKDSVPLGTRHAIKRLELMEVDVMLILAEGLNAFGQALGNFFLEANFLGHELGIAAQDNIRTAAGHVGRYGDYAFASGLGHEKRLALMLLCVQ